VPRVFIVLATHLCERRDQMLAALPVTTGIQQGLTAAAALLALHK